MTEPYYEDDLVTLYHGDCMAIAEWMTAEVLVNDPPYGIAYSKNTNRKAKSYAHAGIAGDADTSLRDAILDLWGNRPAIVFGSWRAAFPRDHRQVLVWKKPIDAGVLGASTRFRRDTELIFLCGPFPRSLPERSSVIETSGGMHAYLRDHPHSKPIPLMQELIGQTTGVIADPTAGAGATLVAASLLNRKAIGVEVDERYCEMIARRLSQQSFDLAGLA